MKITAKENKVKITIGIALLMIIISLLVGSFLKIIKTIDLNRGTYLVLISIILIILYLIFDFVIDITSENYELILEDKCFIYKSVVAVLQKEYEQIKSMRIINKSLGRFGGSKYILRIDVGDIRKIYISLNSMRTKEYKALRALLIKRTGKSIDEKKKK